MSRNRNSQQVLTYEGLEYYDTLIKQYIEEHGGGIGNIADAVPNDIIRQLWYGDVLFDELVPVSGDPDYVPCTDEQILEGFNNIFNE